MMWTAFASTAVTSSLFLTALAPNLLALGMNLLIQSCHLLAEGGHLFSKLLHFAFERFGNLLTRAMQIRLLVHI